MRLKGVSFGLRSDETIALVGSTGSGKTSVINLINRFYEHNKGDILIDGISLRDYDSTSLRKHIAVVLQDVFLFSDTIYNNIVLGDTSITREKVTKAAEMIGAMDFINKLPGAFDYHVGERGNLLSMGQRQLISFIRAYVTDPAILILDEATSSIDTESEELITRATEILTKGRSSIVIAHRLATVLNADKIIVLDHGKILESGPHQVLIKNGGHYMNLFKTQFESH